MSIVMGNGLGTDRDAVSRPDASVPGHQGWHSTLGSHNKKNFSGTVKHLDRPRKVTKTALFLTSDDASFVLGLEVAADGGRLLNAMRPGFRRFTSYAFSGTFPAKLYLSVSLPSTSFKSVR
ncbi:MAG TPA: hypothetical protein VFA09_25700 [Ktedonobacteraceae bacterium]|nr:hypothetical protein [Ktedonobacteraceae bacterium]